MGYVKKDGIMKIRKVEVGVGGNNRVVGYGAGSLSPKKGQFLGLLELTLLPAPRLDTLKNVRKLNLFCS